MCVADSLTVNVKVSINQNITGLIGNNNTSLTCVFIKEANKRLTGIEVIAKNKTEDFKDGKPIAIFVPNKPAILHLYGQYLTGRVTLTNITSTSTNATLTFKELKCDDERDYLCKYTYKDKYGSISSEKSQPTRISVHVMSSKPDHISSIIVASTTEMQGSTSSIYKTTLSSQKGDSFSIPSSIETVTKTQLPSNDNLPLVYNEEDNVMFTCTGNIGNPPGKFIWQKTFSQGKTPIVYSNETTYIEEIPGTCSFNGTSHLTVKIYAEDIKAKIRCFEESQANETDMYLETEPFDVLFQINHVDINKQPNLQQYDTKTDNITLSCKFKGIGNPQPSYVWFKEGKNNSILSNKSVYVIENVIRKNSGVYICEVYNIIDDIHYRKSNSMGIHIVYVDELPSSTDSSLLKIVIVYMIPVVCVVLFIGICVAVIKHFCIRPKKKETEETYYQTLSHDGITVNAEYTSVIHTNNTYVGEAKDDLVCSNGKERNENNSRNRDELLTGYLTCMPTTGSTSVNDPDNYDDVIASDQTVVYDEINQERTLNTEVSKAYKSISTDHGDHYDIIDVAMQSSVNDG
ncbi:unnamed protein product [Mytilus edulis]|uniref:Ig-like domain-containing protein n=1 Tax=Mytilus edulis TaxID=6550 RepID=A0A8S3TFL4_MYTED|nr:unnamed protein product [Mytilus edulis]